MQSPVHLNSRFAINSAPVPPLHLSTLRSTPHNDPLIPSLTLDQTTKMRVSIVAAFLAGAAAVAAQSTTDTASAASATSAITPCIESCSEQGAEEAGCSSFTDVTCVCTSTQFQTLAGECLAANCTAAEQQAALGLQQSICGANTNASSSISASAASAINSITSAAGSEASHASSSALSKGSSVESSASVAATSSKSAGPINLPPASWMTGGLAMLGMVLGPLVLFA